MGDDAGVLPQSLQPWARHASKPDSFASVLGRIYNERGHFRDISEAALRDEITTQAIAGPSTPDEDNSEPDTPTATGAANGPSGKDGGKSRGEQLQAARRTVLEHVASAQNEALLALDFVSLVLSKDVRGAEATISPFLKQSVPTGTLGIDMWAGMQTDPDVERTDELLARGKRMQVLGESAGALIKASERLGATVERERRYWEQMLKVKNEGWALCRIPRERGTLGVRYGFGEAYGEFKARGLAALRMGDEGAVILDQGLGKGGQTIRVVIKEGERVLGRSSPKRENQEQDDIGKRIRSARDSLFEEELWHELVREARPLGPYGIILKGSSVVMPMSYSQADASETDPQPVIELDLVSTAGENDGHASSPLSDGIATALRLLLANTHRERLRRRSQIPPPLSTTKQEKPTSEIVRPLLSLMHHQAAAADLRELLRGLTAALKNVLPDVRLSTTDPLAAVLEPTTSAAELLSRLAKPLTWSATLTMTANGSDTQQDGQQAFTFTTTTAFSPPYYGTRFDLTTASRREFERSTSSLADITEHIQFVMRSALTMAIKPHLDGWSADWRRGILLQAVTDGGGGSGRQLSVVVQRPDLSPSNEVNGTLPTWWIGLASGTDDTKWITEAGESDHALGKIIQSLLQGSTKV